MHSSVHGGGDAFVLRVRALYLQYSKYVLICLIAIRIAYAEFLHDPWSKPVFFMVSNNLINRPALFFSAERPRPIYAPARSASPVGERLSWLLRLPLPPTSRTVMQTHTRRA